LDREKTRWCGKGPPRKRKRGGKGVLQSRHKKGTGCHGPPRSWPTEGRGKKKCNVPSPQRKKVRETIASVAYTMKKGQAPEHDTNEREKKKGKKGDTPPQKREESGHGGAHGGPPSQS